MLNKMQLDILYSCEEKLDEEKKIATLTITYQIEGIIRSFTTESQGEGTLDLSLLDIFDRKDVEKFIIEDLLKKGN